MNVLTQTHTINRRVYMENTDQTGFIYHGDYLNFFQQGRTEWLRFHCQKSLADLAFHFIVRSINMTYKKPLQLDQQFEVTTTCVEKNRWFWVFRQCVACERVDYCVADVKLVCVDKKQNLMQMPKNLDAV